jgi:hypothetical protein
MPDRAAYCGYDGTMLRNGAGGAAAGAMLQEFIFPSGRRCRTFDELAAACNGEWEEAKRLLRDGTFASFLSGIGRADLARLARESQAMPDADLGLAGFAGGLPASPGAGPKLGLSPRRFVVGPIRVGEQKPLQVTLQNEGRGLLQGKLTVTEGAEWLSIAEGGSPSEASIRASRDQVIKLQVNTQALNSSNNYSGKLVAVTNGGVAEIPVRLDLVARPFARGPYAGANDPKDLARRLRDNPRPAVELFENGEIARWFASNGWPYPIVGAPAPGLAAIQQYFEELGLAKAPQVVVSPTDHRVKASPGAPPSLQVTLTSPARKLVYARAECSVPWLKPRAASVAGQGQASFEIDVDPAQLTEDREYPAVVKVVANAGQTFLVQVKVEMSGNRRGWFSSRPAPAPPPPPPPPPPQAQIQPAAAVPLPVPVAAFTAVPRAPAPVTAPPAGGRFGLTQALLAGAVLGALWRLALLFPADVYARMLGSKGPPAPGSLEMWLQTPPPDGPFLRLFVLSTWWIGAVAGVITSWRKGGGGLDLLCGALAGAGAGLAGAATVGCLLVAGDEAPRALMRSLAGSGAGAGLATTIWICLALASWTGIGAVAGAFLSLAGETGNHLLAAVGAPFALALRMVGLERQARWFEPG